jgi:hypothetical protein
MAKQPDNLLLEILKEIRADVRSLKADSKKHGEELTTVRTVMQDWQETTATAAGFAMHANVRLEAVDRKLDELARRVDRLEVDQ